MSEERRACGDVSPRARAIAAVLRLTNQAQQAWVAARFGVWPEAEEHLGIRESVGEIAGLSACWDAGSLRGALAGDRAVGLVFDPAAVCAWVGGRGASRDLIGLTADEVAAALAQPGIAGLYDRASWSDRPIEMHIGGRMLHGCRMSDDRVLLVLS